MSAPDYPSDDAGFRSYRLPGRPDIGVQFLTKNTEDTVWEPVDSTTGLNAEGDHGPGAPDFKSLIRFIFLPPAWPGTLGSI